MTDEELDVARAKKSYEIEQLSVPWECLRASVMAPIIRAAQLAREGYIPVDPLLKEAREIMIAVLQASDMEGSVDIVRRGNWDAEVIGLSVLTAIKRGIEIGKDEK